VIPVPDELPLVELDVPLVPEVPDVPVPDVPLVPVVPDELVPVVPLVPDVPLVVPDVVVTIFPKSSTIVKSDGLILTLSEVPPGDLYSTTHQSHPFGSPVIKVTVTSELGLAVRNADP